MDMQLRSQLEENKGIQLLNAMFQELLGIGIISLIEFKQQHGEFATMMLIQSRINRRDPMREAVEELYNDKAFMININPEVTKMVHDALYHNKFQA